MLALSVGAWEGGVARSVRGCKAGVAWHSGHAEGRPFEPAQQGMPRSRPLGDLAWPTDGKVFKGGQEGLRGLRRETPVASGAGHHLGYKENLVGLLHISLELQQS